MSLLHILNSAVSTVHTFISVIMIPFNTHVSLSATFQQLPLFECNCVNKRSYSNMLSYSKHLMSQKIQVESSLFIRRKVKKFLKFLKNLCNSCKRLLISNKRLLTMEIQIITHHGDSIYHKTPIISPPPPHPSRK